MISANPGSSSSTEESEEQEVETMSMAITTQAPGVPPNPGMLTRGRLATLPNPPPFESLPSGRRRKAASVHGDSAFTPADLPQGQVASSYMAGETSSPTMDDVMAALMEMREEMRRMQADLDRVNVPVNQLPPPLSEEEEPMPPPPPPVRIPSAPQTHVTHDPPPPTQPFAVGCAPPQVAQSYATGHIPPCHTGPARPFTVQAAPHEASVYQDSLPATPGTGIHREELEDFLNDWMRKQSLPIAPPMGQHRPYPIEIEREAFPEGFKMPTFEKFNGTGNPHEHLNSFTLALGNHWNNGNLCLRLFGSSLTGSAFQWYLTRQATAFKALAGNGFKAVAR